jgi:hypothetical protein
MPEHIPDEVWDRLRDALVHEESPYVRGHMWEFLDAAGRSIVTLVSTLWEMAISQSNPHEGAKAGLLLLKLGVVDADLLARVETHAWRGPEEEMMAAETLLHSGSSGRKAAFEMFGRLSAAAEPSFRRIAAERMAVLARENPESARSILTRLTQDSDGDVRRAALAALKAAELVVAATAK